MEIVEGEVLPDGFDAAFPDYTAWVDGLGVFGSALEERNEAVREHVVPKYIGAKDFSHCLVCRFGFGVR